MNDPVVNETAEQRFPFLFLLQELFRKAPPIDFGYGYRWRRNESNLLLAVRSDAAVTGSTGASGNP